MLKKSNETQKIEVENVSMIHNMAIGSDNETFAIAINEGEDGTYEGVYTIQPKHLKEIVMMLFDAGVRFQEETGVDIGFGIGEDYED